MATFRVEPERLFDCGRQLQDVNSTLLKLTGELAMIDFVSITTVATWSLVGRLTQITKNVGSLTAKSSTLVKTLTHVGEEYQNTETTLANSSTRGSVASGAGSNYSQNGLGVGAFAGVGAVAAAAGNAVNASGVGEKSAAYWKGSVEADGKILGFDSSGKATADVLQASYDTKFGSKVKWKEDSETGKKKFDTLTLFEAGVEGKAHVASGKLEGSIGGLQGAATGTVGAISAAGSLGANLYKGGKLSPQIYAKAEAKASAAEGKIQGSLGTDEFDAHAKASGKALTATAKAEAAMGKVTYTNKATGKEVTGWGGVVEAGAEAYLAEGKVSGGIKLFGIDIDVGVSGKAGGAGVKAGAAATTGGFTASVGAGLGLGAGLDISIDWSDFKFWW